MKVDIKTPFRWLAGTTRRMLDSGLPPDQDTSNIDDGAPKQQWQQLASRGHQLLAQVNVLEGRRATYIVLIGVLSLAIVMSLWLSALGARGVSSTVSWVVDSAYSVAHKVGDKVDSLTAEPVTLVASKAPNVAPIQYVEGKGENDPSQILNIDAVRERMLSWGALLDKGQPIPADQCDQTKKIHEPWFGAGDVAVRCRISADKKRVWVWGWAFASADPSRRGQYEPEGGGFAAVLYRAAGINGWTLAAVDVPAAGKRGMITMPVKDLADAAVKEAEAANQLDNASLSSKYESVRKRDLAKAVAAERFTLNQRRVPRSIAADFPELVLADDQAQNGSQKQTAAEARTSSMLEQMELNRSTSRDLR